MLVEGKGSSQMANVSHKKRFHADLTTCQTTGQDESKAQAVMVQRWTEPHLVQNRSDVDVYGPLFQF